MRPKVGLDVSERKKNTYHAFNKNNNSRSSSSIIVAVAVVVVVVVVVVVAVVGLLRTGIIWPIIRDFFFEIIPVHSMFQKSVSIFTNRLDVG